MPVGGRRSFVDLFIWLHLMSFCEASSSVPVRTAPTRHQRTTNQSCNEQRTGQEKL